MTSLSPVCGLDVFTTPTPQAFWSTLTHTFRPERKKVGTVKAGWSQHVGVALMQLGLLAQPVIPAHVALGFPHAMHTGWLQVGGESAAATVKVALMPRGKGRTTPPAEIHGVGKQPPLVPPQSASLRHGWSWLAAVPSSHTPGPVTSWML